MKNLLLVVSIAFLGACSNYTTGNARHQCCADAMANGEQCCETTDAKSMSAGSADAKECSSAAATCESAAATSCSEKSAMSCCDEAKAASKECADCVKP